MILFFFFLVLLLGITQADAKTITVGFDKDNDYFKIQDAIDNSSNGDTIFVEKGIYHENLTINRSIILIGEDINSTIIKGPMKEYVDIITITASNVKITGFSITQGDRAINIEKSRNIIIDNNLIFDNYRSIGIYHSYYVMVINNNISNNKGYGIHIGQSDYNIISNNTIIQNKYNGIVIGGGSFNSIKNNIVHNNQDGIIISESSSNSIENNNITQNLRYGIYFDDLYNPSENVTINNNIIAGNEIYGINAWVLFTELSYEIDAKNNWWGDDSGPYHPEHNPNGKGDKVTDNVIFDPWLTQEKNDNNKDGFISDAFIIQIVIVSAVLIVLLYIGSLKRKRN
jgi:parallel beta-helix repeat protein